MSLVSFRVKQWSDPDGDLDSGATLAADALATELLAVASAAHDGRLGCRLLILKLIRELLCLAESYLSLKASILLVLESLLLLLEPV